MDSSQFIRDKQSVIKTLQQNADSSVVTLTGCSIYIPKRFVEKSMAEIGSSNYTIGFFPIVTDDNKYLLFSAIAYVYLNPSEIKTCSIDNIEFIEFRFDKNTTVINSMQLVQKDTLVYSVFNEFITNGNIPWYMTYDDAGNMFDTASSIAGTSIGSNPEIIEILVSFISRQKQNRMLSFRHLYKDGNVDKNITPAYIALKSVTYSAKNTTAKLAGSHFDEGITSALNNPTNKPDTIGSILRK